MMEILCGSIRGLGYSILPTVVTLLGACGLRILWIYTIFQIPQFHTPQCLYFSYLVSWSITFVIQISVFLKNYRRQLSIVSA